MRYGTTGWPVPGYEISLRGDDGGPVPDGEPGDLYIHGPSAAMMYWGNRQKTRDTFQGGWTKSGDKYIRNADGSYTYGGRSDDMLKVSGIYVSPFEVEATLVQHPAVLEAAVIGVPDAEGLTKTKAFVVLKQGASATDAELKAFVKDKLAPYKYPRLIVFVNDLPKTATGKIQRFKLRERGGRARRELFVRRDRLARPQGPHRARLHCTGAQERAAARVPARRPGLALDVARLPRSACATQPACRGLVYSRPGYGRSTPRAPDEAWDLDFMHRQAPRGAAGAAAQALDIDASARQALAVRPQRRRLDHAALRREIARCSVAGAIVLAPHILVEDLSVDSIAKAKTAYETTDLKQRLAKYHDDPDSPSGAGTASGCTRRSASWSIEARDPSPSAARCSRCRAWTTSTAPWSRSAASRAACRRPNCWNCPHCGHSPHRDQPESLIAAASRFHSLASSVTTGDKHHEAQAHRLITAATALVAASGALAQGGQAQGRPDAAGYTGTFAALGTAIENGFRLHVAEQGGKLGGREIEYVKVDDESDPSKATDNVNKLVKRDNVDVIIGTVHSGRGDGDGARWPRKAGTLLIVPNAGAGAVTGPMCSTQHLPQQLQQLAAGLRDGRGGGQEGPQEGRDHHLEVRRR